MLKFYYKLIFVVLLIQVSVLSIGHAQDSISQDTILTSIPYQYERTDFRINLTSTFKNQFDASEIALDMIITTPSAKSLVLPCFYVSGNNSASVWNARFTPEEPGTYSYYFKLSKYGISVVTTKSKQFTVISTAHDGFIHKNNNWTFVYDSGRPFRGIGENVGWEARSYETQTNRYDYFLPKLAKTGVNFFRTWMCNWNLPVECKTVINTNFYTNSSEYFNPGGIARMDQLVNICDSLHLHMQLVLVPHGALITSGEWNINNYNIANGGPASSPTDFFTSTAAKNMFKNRLRYMVARWGYSPSIGAWELFNEVDNAAYNGGSALSIPESAITDWHTEMSNYLKNIDLYKHLVTTSVSWRDIAGLNDVPDIDYNQQHIYNNTSSIQSTILKYENNWSKPYVIGEYSYDWDWNNVTTANGSNFDYDLKRGLWYGLFTSTPIVPMTWWWEFFDARGMTSYYKSVTDISKQMLLAGSGNFSSATVSSGALEHYALKCGKKYFIYLLNNSSDSISTPANLTVPDNDIYTIKTLEPSKYNYIIRNSIVATSYNLNLGSINLPSRGEIVYIISHAADSSENVEKPFFNKPVSIPGRIEAENFDKGGEGIAYHDFDVSNIPGKYRSTEGVDIDTTNDGSYCISDIVKGEWLKYSINVETEGSYSIDVRVAAADTGKSFRILLDNQYVTESIKIPQTGGLQTWETINVPLNVAKLTQGQKNLQIEMGTTSGLAIDYLNFKLTNAAPKVKLISPKADTSFIAPVSVNVAADASDEDGSIAKVEFYNGATKLGESLASPFSFNWNATIGSYRLYAIAIDDKGLSTCSDTLKGLVSVLPDLPGIVRAENYDIGGEGVGYHDLTPGNKFGYYRNDDVDLEQCTDTNGGYDLGDFSTGEWVQYTVNVTQTGTYNIDFRIATDMSGSGFSLWVDGNNVTGTINVSNNGGWQTWTTISVPGIQLTKGIRKLRLVSINQYVNINYMNFTLATGIENIAREIIYCYPNPVKNTLWITNMPSQSCKIVINNEVGKVVKMCKLSDNSVDVSNLGSGIYFVDLYAGKNEILKRFKVIKE